MPSQDPFTALGGGVQLPNGGWVPRDHPLAQPYLSQSPNTPATAGTAANTPGNTVQGQSSAAQTYSATPGAAPAPFTSNQGTQDVVRNTYLQQATQGTTIDRNDPNFRQQADAYSATQDRARRQYQSEAAERLSAQGLGNSGAMQQERRFSDEQAANSKGQFESELVARELTNRRDEIKDALSGLHGMVSGDQAAALQQQLAQLDAAIKREGLAQSGTLGARDLSIKDKLGTGALNVDLMKALLQNQQFGKDLGLRIGDAESNAFLRSLGL